MAKTKTLRGRAALMKENRANFLSEFAKLQSITHAADAIGVNRETHYRWLKDDPDGYGADFAAAEERGIEALELECRIRATQGRDRPVFYQGKQCGQVRERSDVLLMFMLNAARPEKYRPQRGIEIPEGVTEFTFKMEPIDGAVEEPADQIH